MIKQEGGKMRKSLLATIMFLSVFSVFCSITTLPYTQNFEGTTFPPTEWTSYNVDGQAQQWGANTTNNHTPGGSRSVMHLAGGALPQEEGWLVSPAVVLPSGGGYAMTFWSYNVNPELYSNNYNTILISTTTANPATGNYSGIWSPITVTDNWHPNQVDLSPYQGHTIYIAFRYRGYNAHSWYVDDVTIEENPSIHEFPWTENFESGVFPPYYWWQYDEDGAGESWTVTQSQNHSEDGECSAVHFTGPGESGWLVSPQIHLPATGNYSLSYWSYNEIFIPFGGELYGANFVMLSTQSNSPGSGDFQVVWYNPIPQGDNWFYNVLDLSPWSGQSIYLAFSYYSNGTHNWYVDDVVISEYQGINGFPWVENFESFNFPPDYWSSFDQDGVEPNWLQFYGTPYPEGRSISANHWFTEGESLQDGWLVTPLLRLPADFSATLSFESRNILHGSYGSNSVWISTGSLDPDDGDFTQIWAATTGNQDWVQEAIDLSAWEGQNVYLAFRLQSSSHEWFIDNVLVDAPTEDRIPPIITHLPIINTLRDDNGYKVYVEAQDDPIWNSGIFMVMVGYSVNGGQSNLMQMYPAGNGYMTFIPAQAHGSRIDYYVVAIDNSPQQNMAFSDTFTFYVDDPVWLYYDSLSQSAWVGWNMGNWALGVLYENPLWGLADSLKINKVSSAFMLDDTVTLKIFASNDASLSNLTTLMTPLEVNIIAGQWIETSVNNVYVNSQYFYVVFDDIDSGNFYAADAQRYYPDRCFIDLGDDLFRDLGDVGFNGVWMMRVEVQSGDFFASPVLSILNGSEGPFLRWTAVPGADYYKIYSSADPTATEPWGLFDTTVALELGALGDASLNFFKVTAVKSEKSSIGDYISPRKLDDIQSSKAGNKVPIRSYFIRKK
jgi:hypothetical protein